MSEFCGACGLRLDRTAGAGDGHERCAAALRLEPPRFCGSCGRRMVVQVTPGGWWATCSRHGRIGAA